MVKTKKQTLVKAKRQNFSENEKKILQSKRKDNTIVKAKRQHYSQNEKTTL